MDILIKDDFVKLLQRKKKKYEEIDDGIYVLVNRILEALYKDLETRSYRHIPKNLLIRIFEMTDNERLHHDIELNLPIVYKTPDDMDRISYRIAYILKRDCDIIANEFRDEFDRPDLFIPTNQFMNATSKLEDFSEVKKE